VRQLKATAQPPESSTLLGTNVANSVLFSHAAFDAAAFCFLHLAKQLAERYAGSSNFM
jgi:hypothetical protein